MTVKDSSLVPKDFGKFLQQIVLDVQAHWLLPLRLMFGKHWVTVPLIVAMGLYLEDQLVQDPMLSFYAILFFFVYAAGRLVSHERHLGKKFNRGYLLLGLAVAAGAVVFLNSPVFAQAAGGGAGGGANCGGGLFGPLANFFARALSTAQQGQGGTGGGTGSGAAQQICTLFGLIQAALVVVFVIAIGVAVYQVGQGAEFRTAFTPIALALVVVVAAGIIVQLFMGNQNVPQTGQPVGP